MDTSVYILANNCVAHDNSSKRKNTNCQIWFEDTLKIDKSFSIPQDSTPP